MRILAGAIGLAAGLLIGTPAAIATAVVDDRVIVQWAPGVDRADRAEARTEADVSFERTLGDADFQTVEVDPGQSVGGAIAALSADPAVVVAEPDGWSEPHAPPPNDPLFDQLWGLRNLGGAAGVGGFASPRAGADIDVLGAWLRTVGTPSTVVAVLDTGYRFDHPDLGPVAWENGDEIAGNDVDDDSNGFVDDVRGYDFVGADADSPTADDDPTDDDLASGGHGVHVAGTVGAKGDDGVGVVGVAQNARIMPLRVCAHSPSEKAARCPHSSQIEAINYAGANGARAANMSLGGATFGQAAVNAIAANPQTLFVVSAGNERTDMATIPHYPCAYRPTVDANPPVPGAIDNVVCVAATDQADRLAAFSNYGAASVDLGAPGTETLSADVARDVYGETFEAEGFEDRWTATGPDGGFARTGDGRLTSFGRVDSPGAVVESTSAPLALPAGYGACTYRQRRTGAPADGATYAYAILLDGDVVFESEPDADPGETSSGPIAGLSGGGSVRIRHTHSAGADPVVGNGVWVDDLRLRCFDAPGSGAATFGFKQGTSMATPHVTGAAALLFSQRPDATVAEVRDALLGSVDPLVALAGKTVTGGRLDVSKAIDAFDSDAPDAPELAIAPVGPANDNSPRLTGSAEERSRVAVYADGGCAGAPVATVDAATLAAPGVAVTVADNSVTSFSATATDTADNVSDCSAPVAYTESTPPVEPEPPVQPPLFDPPLPDPPLVVPGPPDGDVTVAPPRTCRVPKLASLTLPRARAALRRASCRIGKVAKPKRRKGQRRPAPLIVKSSRPKAGAERTAGAKVAVTLGPKPRPKQRKRR
jgi:subtilisin family serine protease